VAFEEAIELEEEVVLDEEAAAAAAAAVHVVDVVEFAAGAWPTSCGWAALKVEREKQTRAAGSQWRCIVVKEELDSAQGVSGTRCREMTVGGNRDHQCRTLNPRHEAGGGEIAIP
jgi:hypothetical protein